MQRFVALALLATCCADLIEIVDLDEAQLWIQSHDKSVMLLQHGADCTACDEFAPAFERIAQRLGATLAAYTHMQPSHVWVHDTLTFCRVDFTIGDMGGRVDGQAKLLMTQAQGVAEERAFDLRPGPPMLKVFYFSGERGKRVREYDGALEHDAVWAWLSEALSGEGGQPPPGWEGHPSTRPDPFRWPNVRPEYSIIRDTDWEAVQAKGGQIPFHIITEEEEAAAYAR